RPTIVVLVAIVATTDDKWTATGQGNRNPRHRHSSWESTRTDLLYCSFSRRKAVGGRMSKGMDGPGNVPRSGRQLESRYGQTGPSEIMAVRAGRLLAGAVRVDAFAARVSTAAARAHRQVCACRSVRSAGLADGYYLGSDHGSAAFDAPDCRVGLSG